MNGDLPKSKMRRGDWVAPRLFMQAIAFPPDGLSSILWMCPLAGDCGLPTWMEGDLAPDCSWVSRLLTAFALSSSWIPSRSRLFGTGVR